jgi:hypothetical protein
VPTDPSAWVIKEAAGSSGTAVSILRDMAVQEVDLLRDAIGHSWSRTPMIAQRYVEPSRLAQAYRVELRLVAYVLGSDDVYVGQQPVGKAVPQQEKRRLNNISQGALYVPIVCDNGKE